MEAEAVKREEMVSRQIVARGVRDSQVLRAMRKVPREQFVPAEQAEFAYEDAPLPIGEGQTISQPYIVELMLEAARLAASDRMLEVGSGSGSAAAVASRICRAPSSRRRCLPAKRWRRTRASRR